MTGLSEEGRDHLYLEDFFPISDEKSEPRMICRAVRGPLSRACRGWPWGPPDSERGASDPPTQFWPLTMGVVPFGQKQSLKLGFPIVNKSIGRKMLRALPAD